MHFATLLVVALGAEQVGEKIRQARLAKGWTHQDFADAVSRRVGRRVNLRTVQRWQKGRNPKTGESWLPRLNTLLELADLLEVPRSYLVEEEQGEEGAYHQLLARIDRLEATEAQNQELLAELLRAIRGEQGSDPADAESS